MKTLGGTTIVRNAISQDYCILEAIDSLSDACDKVLVGDCYSDDGTLPLLLSNQNAGRWPNVRIVAGLDWNCVQGKERLSILSTEIFRMLDTEWNLYIQADEVLHEDSIPYIRSAIEMENEAYHVRRYNLWGSPITMVRLDLEGRKPVSDIVCRLAKAHYPSYGDAESINAPGVPDLIEKIRIFHMGFVRDKWKHVDKIIQMQRDVFCMGPDPRCVAMKKEGRPFDPWEFFSPSDLEPAPSLPKYVKEWASIRS